MDGGEAGPGRRRDRLTTLAGVLGELLVTCGVVALLFVVYEVYVTDLVADRRQGELAEQLHEDWDDDAAPAPRVSIIGDAFAVLHIPRLGPDYQRVVLEGTAEEQLSQGPGHYNGTAMPGEQGNVAFAGHRVGKGSPFLELDTLVPGDPIIVETRDMWFVYRVLGDRASGEFTSDPSGIPGMQVVRPGDTEVISPTPNATPDVPASGAYLTLTTCHPRYSARERLIIHAALEGAGVSKIAEPTGPSALNER
jgi:sortase (surface protein transpeptidase)